MPCIIFRELKEEAGVNVAEESVEKVADLEFTFDGQDILMHVHVFLAKSFSGSPMETEGSVIFFKNV